MCPAPCVTYAVVSTKQSAASKGETLVESVVADRTAGCIWHVHVGTCSVGIVGVYLFSQATANLLSHTLGNTHSRHSAGLSAANLAPAGVARLSQVLSHLGGLAGACLSDDHQHLVVGHSLDDLVLEAVDGQALSLLFYAAAVFDAVRGSLQDACGQACSHTGSLNCKVMDKSCLRTSAFTSKCA